MNNYGKRIFILLLSILFIDDISYSQIEQTSRSVGDKPFPLINNYPPAIQRLDSMKVKFYKDRNDLESMGKKYEHSEKFLKDYARADISSRLFYSKIDGSGLAREYKMLTAPIGSETMKLLKRLPYPWGILIEKHGIVLAEVLNDTILPKMNHPFPEPTRSKNVYNYVLKAKIIDDIFGSVEEDTVLIRHNLLITDENIFNQYKDVKLIFTLKTGGTVQREGYVERIYLMGTPTEFMYVADGIIYDVNDAFKKNGITYQEFKNELLDFMKSEGIQP